eukprot:4181384-Pyramimonas_sp.AAC.1
MRRCAPDRIIKQAIGAGLRPRRFSTLEGRGNGGRGRGKDREQAAAAASEYGVGEGALLSIALLSLFFLVRAGGPAFPV